MYENEFAWLGSPCTSSKMLCHPEQTRLTQHKRGVLNTAGSGQWSLCLPLATQGWNFAFSNALHFPCLSLSFRWETREIPLPYQDSLWISNNIRASIETVMRSAKWIHVMLLGKLPEKALNWTSEHSRLENPHAGWAALVNSRKSIHIHPPGVLQPMTVAQTVLVNPTAWLGRLLIESAETSIS